MHAKKTGLDDVILCVVLFFNAKNVLTDLIFYYSLLPKERHVRKESNDSTLGLCIGLKESHGCTLYSVQVVYTVDPFPVRQIITYFLSKIAD